MIAISVITIILLMLLILLHDGIKDKDGFLCFLCIVFLIAGAASLGLMLSQVFGLPAGNTSW